LHHGKAAPNLKSWDPAAGPGLAPKTMPTEPSRQKLRQDLPMLTDRHVLGSV
jgi:hypothetical protein